MKSSFITRQYGAPQWANPFGSPYWRLACVPPEYWEAPRFQATYTTQFTPILGGQTMVDQFSVPDYGPFIIYGMTAFANNPGAVPPLLRWGSGQGSGFPSRTLVQITDSLLDYKLFSKAIPLDNFVGGAGGEGAFIPYVCPANTTMSVILTSLNAPGAGEDWNWFINFTGAQLIMPEAAA